MSEDERSMNQQISDGGAILVTFILVLVIGVASAIGLTSLGAAPWLSAVGGIGAIILAMLVLGFIAPKTTKRVWKLLAEGLSQGSI